MSIEIPEPDEKLAGYIQAGVFPAPDPKLAEFMGLEWTRKFYATCNQGIAQMEVDPLQYGFEPASWKLADKAIAEFREEFPVGVIVVLVLGGNRGAKTEWRSKRTDENLFRNKDYKTWACQATQEASREAQQTKIYKYLPPEYRNESGRMRHGAKVKVNYTPWGGFTEDVFAVQNIHGTTSECRFKFYSMNARSIEGAEINEGWLDEEAPLDWLEALMIRAASRNGIVYLTFTPKWGYSSTVKALLQGAIMVKETDADMDLIGVRDARGKIIGPKKVPLIQRNLNITIPGDAGKLNAKAIIIYFHTSENPFPITSVKEPSGKVTVVTNWDCMKSTLMGASEAKILTTAYGVPTKAMMSKFPLFSDTPHVISLNRFREIQKGGETWFHFVDPCDGRNWFQIWIFCDVTNRAFVVGESPSHNHEWAYIPGVGNPGPWAVPGRRADGEEGDGQKEWGWGYKQYIEEIERMERLLALPGEDTSRNDVATAHRIKVSARWVDARYANRKTFKEERSMTLIEDLEALGLQLLAAPSEKVIDSGRGGGDGSLRMINDRLFYDNQRAIDQTNQPKLYVVETCPNVIFSLKEWTGQDGQKGKSKDPIDCLRMFVLSGSEHVDEGLLQPRTPWLSQFKR